VLEARRQIDKICHIICKKVPDGGTNIVAPDQISCVVRNVWSGPVIFVTHELLQKAFLLLPVQCLP